MSNIYLKEDLGSRALISEIRVETVVRQPNIPSGISDLCSIPSNTPNATVPVVFEINVPKGQFLFNFESLNRVKTPASP